MSVEHGKTWVFLYGEFGDARGVLADPAGDPPGHSFVTVVLSDSQGSEKMTYDGPVCGHCLIEKHPEAGRGIDLALKHGGGFERDPVTGEWAAAPPDSNFYFEDLE